MDIKIGYAASVIAIGVGIVIMVGAVGLGDCTNCSTTIIAVKGLVGLALTVVGLLLAKWMYRIEITRYKKSLKHRRLMEQIKKSA